MYAKLSFNRINWSVILTALRLYQGEFFWDYGGAKYFNLEASCLIKRIPNAIYSSFYPKVKIELKTPEEIMAIIRALEVYLGYYHDDYHGATLWRHEAKMLHRNMLKKFREKIKHLL